MDEKWFSYDPECGFETHPTAAEAEIAALGSLLAYREEAGDGWSDEVDRVCWGELRAWVLQTSSTPDSSGRFDTIDEYELVAVTV